MKRIDTNNAVDGKFVAGDAERNPTFLSASWLNSLQEEVAGYIESQGLTLDPDDEGQLRKAIENHVGDASAIKLAGSAEEIRSLDPEKHPVVMLIGNGAGLFRWIADSTKAENGVLIDGVKTAGTIIGKAENDEDGAWERVYVGPVHFGWFSHVNTRGTDNADAFDAFLSFADRAPLPRGDYDCSRFLNNASGKLEGYGFHLSKIYYTGNPMAEGTFLKYSSGAVLKDFRLIGPFSKKVDENGVVSGTDVANHLIGISDSAGVGQIGQANRATMQGVRVESFGINEYRNDTQNMTTQGCFFQYAKYAEIFYENTENNWPNAMNTNSGIQAGYSLDEDYRLIRLKGNRNLRLRDGIHERAHGVSEPFLIDSSSVSFNGVEFNGTDGVVIKVQAGSSVVMNDCAGTLTGGVDEIYIETDEVSGVRNINPRMSGTEGRHTHSLYRGNVGDGSERCAITLFGGSNLSNFQPSSGGGAEMEGNVLNVVGKPDSTSNGSGGVMMMSQSSNNSFKKRSDDNISSIVVRVVVKELRSSAKAIVYLPLPASPWKVFVGEITGPGIHEFYHVPGIDEDVGAIGIGVLWDGTEDAQYGNRGVCQIVGRITEIYK